MGRAGIGATIGKCVERRKKAVVGAFKSLWVAEGKVNRMSLWHNVTYEHAQVLY